MKIFKLIREYLSYKYCDNCGFTKNDVFITEHFLEAGLRLCNKCNEKL
jgi:C4-type Zn-finger protein